jgi:hypothetical protein
VKQRLGGIYDQCRGAISPFLFGSPTPSQNVLSFGYSNDHHTEFLEFGRRFLILIARNRFVVLSFNR